MNQIIIPRSAPICAQVFLPGSKSITNRALLIAALARGKTTLKNVLFSDDTVAFIGALRALGVKLLVAESQNEICVVGTAGIFSVQQANIDCNEAGTCARFLLALCANLPGQYEITGGARLRSRPLKPLISVLEKQGAKITSFLDTVLPLLCENRSALIGGDIEIDAKLSSQFVSALLMVAPYFQNDTRILVNDMISEPYVRMTTQMMEDFGVDVFVRENHYAIAAHQKYQAREYHIEPDASTASYFFAAAAVCGGSILVHGLDREKSLQGDVRFVEILETMGCRITQFPEGIELAGGASLQGITVNMNDCSDTFMTLCMVAAFAEGPTHITGIAHTRLQESDRIEAVEKNLKMLGLRVETTEDSITVFPGKMHGGIVDSCRDHRIAMAFSILGLRQRGIEIQGAECVSKTCADFFERIAGL